MNEEKIRQIFGTDIVIDDSCPQFAPQPDHVRYYKIKKRFGEDVALEFITKDGEKTLTSQSEKATNGNVDLQKSRRVQKFFGQVFDVNEATYLARLNHGVEEDIQTTHPTGIQPAHVDVPKLNRFFGRNTNVQKRNLEQQHSIDIWNRRRNTLDSSGSIPDIDIDFDIPRSRKDSPQDRNTLANSEVSDESSIKLKRSGSSDSVLESVQPPSSKILASLKGYSSEDDEHSYEMWNTYIKTLKTRKKLKSIFGRNLDVDRDRYSKQFAPQPNNVKTFKLKKIFGGDVAVDYCPYKPRPKSRNSLKVKSKKEEKMLKKNRKIKSFFGENNKEVSVTNDTKKKSKKHKQKKE